MIVNFGEFLFWLHVVIIAIAIVSGFFLPLPVVIAAIVVHKLHLVIFGDCLLTKIKRHIAAIEKSEDFLQHAVRRFFHQPINRTQSNFINYCIYGITLLLSISQYK